MTAICECHALENGSNNRRNHSFDHKTCSIISLTIYQQGCTIVYTTQGAGIKFETSSVFKFV